MSRDKTAEQLRERELFEEGVKKWPNYSDRTLIRDGHYPDYYGKPVVQGAWEGFKLGLRTRADSGEAVAWQFRNVTEEGPSPVWHDIDKSKFNVLRNDPHAEVRELFTQPRASRKVAVPAGYVLIPIELAENFAKSTHVPRFRRILEEAMLASQDEVK